MFFLETSGRSWLTPREACALESAARFSGLRVNIILTSSFLDLYDNSTCFLYMFSNISFFTIKLRDAFQDTPLDRFYQREEYRRSEHKTTHLSDALRYALVYKQGGFYSDLDTVTIRSIAITSLSSLSDLYLQVPGSPDQRGRLHHSERGGRAPPR